MTPLTLGPGSGATDTHVHVFDPARFPYAPERAYTPGEASVAQLLNTHAALGIERVVLVQPSVQGCDNRALLAAIAAVGLQRGRGVAVVDLDTVTPEQIAALHTGGVRGLRLNLEVRHEADPARALALLRQAARVACRPDWCVQVHGAASLLPALAQALPDFHGPLVLDHFAGLKAGEDRSAAMAVLLDLLASGRVHVKCSAFYRASGQAPDHEDLGPLVTRLIEARPDRLLWGSDWPHTGGGRARDPSRIEPFRIVDLPASLRALARWCGDDALLRQILVDNPAALYGFGLPS